MELQDVERELHRIRIERQRLDEMEKAYRIIMDLMNSSVRPSIAKLSQTEIVRESVERMPGPFKATDVYVDIKHGYRDTIPKPHISAILSELAKDRFIRVVSRGVGRRGSVYERS
jgi:hypothetical protein